MRRMYTENQLIKVVKDNAVDGIKNKDIQVAGITSAGIANTGEIANIGGITATDGIIGKTLQQSEANAVYTTTLTKEDGAINLTETIYFKKVCIINNILYFVGTYRLANTTETNITSGSLKLTFDVDNAVGEKIYCTNDEKLSDDFTSQRIIAFIPLLRGSATIGATLYKTAKNQISIDLPVSTINAGRNYDYSFRDFIILL